MRFVSLFVSCFLILFAKLLPYFLKLEKGCGYETNVDKGVKIGIVRNNTGFLVQNCGWELSCRRGSCYKHLVL